MSKRNIIGICMLMLGLMLVGVISAAQCSDGIDNDLDGKIDYPEDDGCSSSSGRTESIKLGYADGCFVKGDALKDVFGKIKYQCKTTKCFACVLMTEVGNYTTRSSSCSGLPQCGFSGGGGTIELDVTPPELVVNSPGEGEVFDSRKVLFDLECVNEPCSFYVIDNINGRGRESRIASDKWVVSKSLSLKDGFNNFTVRAVDDAKNPTEIIRTFFVDSTLPRVKGTYPKKGFAGGEFVVEYDEANVEEVILYYGEKGTAYSGFDEVVLSGCDSGKKQSCSIDVDLSGYDGDEIEYWFSIEDITENVVESKKVSLRVDDSAPVIVDLDYEKDGKYVYFTVEVDEVNFDEVGYSYIDSRGKLKEKRLCSKLINNVCVKKVSFKDGEHEVSVYVLDEVGKNDSQVVSFTIDSKKPKISKTYPKKNSFASGVFEVQFKEENPSVVRLFYDDKVSFLDIEEDCEIIKGKYYCEKELVLGGYNNQDIEYWFEVEDIVGNVVESKRVEVRVDMVKPRILNAESFWEQGEGKYARYVYFDINIDEINFDEVVYFYEDSKGKLREKRLCSRLKDGRCIAKKSFRDGEVLLNIQINDEAGNYEVGVVGLDVDY